MADIINIKDHNQDISDINTKIVDMSATELEALTNSINTLNALLEVDKQIETINTDVQNLKQNGVSQDNINSAVEEYLTNNPVQSGATTEQAAQIEANKNNITGLTESLKNVDAVSLNGKTFSNIMSKAEYDAISDKDPNTIYLVDDDQSISGVPDYSASDANKVLAVNSDGTAMAWIDAPSGSGTGLTSEQISQLQTAYEHSQSIHVNSVDIPTKVSQLENDSKFVTQTQLDNVVISAGGFTVKNLSASEISEILTGISAVIPVESIVASTNYLSINVGETRQITYTISPANATDKTVVYRSSDDSKLTVDQEGNIEAIEAGDFMITLTCSNGVSTDCQVVVSEVSETVDVTGISLSKSSLSMHTGDSISLTASITPDTATNKSVTWESNSPTIASVSNGNVTALADGNAIITCRSVSNPDITATCTVNVTTLETLTTITDGLVHSYNLAGLSGDSTTIDDLTGSVALTMEKFSDVAAAKTVDGIVSESGDSTLYQGQISPNVTNKYSIAFTVKGEVQKGEGLLACNTTNKRGNFAISFSNTGDDLCVTDSSYAIGGAYSVQNEFIYDTLVVTVDYDIKEIKLYGHGELIGETDFTTRNWEWNNIARFNTGYWGGKAGVCYRNILFYNKILNEDEVKTITSEICPNNYNTSNSNIITANTDIVTHISSKSTTNEDNTLDNLVNTNFKLSVLSSDENGFLTDSNVTLLKQKPYEKATYVYKIGTIPNDDNDKRLFTGVINFMNPTQSVYVSIKNSDFIVRNGGTYFGNTTLDSFDNNIVIVESDYSTKNVSVYFNNTLLSGGHANTNPAYFIGFQNSVIPIKEFIIYNRFLSEEEKTSLYNELNK